MPSLGFKASHSYMQARYTNSNAGIQGNTPSSIPTHHGTVQLEWHPFNHQPFNLLGGIIFVGERWGDDDNSFKLPRYIRFDISAHDPWKPITLRIAVNNLLDKRYINAAFSDSDVYQGDRRTIKATFTYRF